MCRIQRRPDQSVVATPSKRRAYWRVDRWGELRRRLGKRWLLAASLAAWTHVATAARVTSVSSNCAGRFVLDWVTIARESKWSPCTTSRTLRRTRSQLRSLLSIPRLKSARSRRRPPSARRIRIAQICSRLSGRGSTQSGHLA